MYQLRRQIRDGIGVKDGLQSATTELEEDLEEGLEALMGEALQSKCPEDGKNLLMYAASQGNEEWFLYFVRDIRKRVSVGENPRI